MPAIADLLRDEWAAHQREPGPGVTGLVQFYGSTRAAADAVGVSQRTIQRNVVREEGRAAQQARGVGAKLRAGIERVREAAAQNGAAAVIRRKGITVARVTGDFSVNNDPDYLEAGRTIKKSVTLAPDDLDELLDAAEADEWERAATVFVREYFAEYGVPSGSWGANPDAPDVDAMQFRFG